ncbi:unnamed protein product, partial [Effrenium voratum]
MIYSDDEGALNSKKSQEFFKAEGQRKEGEKKPCVYFAGEGCRMGRNCNYSHDWSLVDKKADLCWICGSLQHRKGECPVKHEAAGKAGFRQAQGEQQQQNKSQPIKPKVAAEKGELLTEATGLLKSLSIVKVIRVRSVKLEEEFYGLLDGGLVEMGYGISWNNKGRQVEQARSVVLHLFSGKDQSFWQDAGEAVLCLDLRNGTLNLNELTLQFRTNFSRDSSGEHVKNGPANAFICAAPHHFDAQGVIISAGLSLHQNIAK